MQPIKDITEVDKIKELLHLEYLESGESGFYSQITESAIEVLQNGQAFRANSSIYYMLTEKYPINYLHWLAMDDIHIICKGGSVSYYVFNEDGTSKQYTIGSDIFKGELLTLMIPAGSRKALKLHNGVEFALMVSVLTPEWTQDRVIIGAGEEFVKKYAHSSEWATPEFLRELKGDNFKD
jgi:predicted cupin superfamily sugar epimerase